MPHASAAIVSVARFFCSRAERRKSCKMSETDFNGRSTRPTGAEKLTTDLPTEHPAVA